MGPETIRIIALVLISMLTAAVVSFTGLIGFVCPHIARIFVGSNNRYLIPTSAAFDAALLLAADVVGRTILAPSIIQVGVITAFIRGPMFLYLIVKQKKEVA